MEVRIKIRNHVLMAVLLFSGMFLLSPQVCDSMTVAGKPGTAGDNAAITPLSSRSISFLGWKGNKLMTTAGTFIVKDTVLVIDKAGTRTGKYKNYPRTKLPSVQVFYKNKKLYKIIIE